MLAINVVYRLGGKRRGRLWVCGVVLWSKVVYIEPRHPPPHTPIHNAAPIMPLSHKLLCAGMWAIVGSEWPPGERDTPHTLGQECSLATSVQPSCILHVSGPHKDHGKCHNSHPGLGNTRRGPHLLSSLWHAALFKYIPVGENAENMRIYAICLFNMHNLQC